MRIQINGEQISLPVPVAGKKTTISLEDSTGTIQISVGKIGKQQQKQGTQVLFPETPVHTKKVRWFGELELAYNYISGIWSPRYEARGDIFTSAIYHNGGSVNTSGYESMKRVFPEEEISSGVSLGLSIKEKSRLVKRINLQFITGTRFRLTKFWGKGNYTVRDVKMSIKDGMVNYYWDTFSSSRNGQYKSRINVFQLIFPFMLEGKLKATDLRWSAGINLGLSINTSVLKEYYYRETSASAGLQIQPILKISKNRTSLFLSYSLNREIIGYDAGTYVAGRFLTTGLAYKLY